MKKTLIAMTAAAIAFSPVAMAGETFPVEFTYERAELQTEAGAKAVYERLNDKIEKACKAEANGRVGVAAYKMKQDCIKAATEEAVDQINTNVLVANSDTENEKG